MKKQFLKECGIDLTDYEYVGKFPILKKNGKWGNISRGEGWKRYSDWLEKQNHELKEGVEKAIVLINDGWEGHAKTDLSNLINTRQDLEKLKSIEK